MLLVLVVSTNDLALGVHNELSIKLVRMPLQVVLDTIFLEASLQLVEDKEWLCSDVLGECTSKVERYILHPKDHESLQAGCDLILDQEVMFYFREYCSLTHWCLCSLTFDWILKFDHYIPQAEKNDPYRSYVTNILGRLVRSLAWGRLEVISAIFFKALKLRIETESHAPLQEVVWLLTAMRGIQLSFDSDNDIAAAVNFLDHADPLKHVAPHKKSQVCCKIAHIHNAQSYCLLLLSLCGVHCCRVESREFSWVKLNCRCSMP